MRCAVLALAVSLAATPSLAQPPAATPPPGAQSITIPVTPPGKDVLDGPFLILTPGRSVTLSLGDNNAMSVVEEKASDMAVAPSAQPDAYATTPVAIRGLRQVAPDRVTLTLLRNPDHGVSLIFQDGVGRPLTLAAATSMVVNGKRSVSLSTICTAVPGKPDFETWPNDFDLVVVLQVLDSRAGVCFDPKVKQFYKDGNQPPSARPPAAPPAPEPH